MYDARKRKAMCSNRLCSGKYSVFGLNLSPLSWGSERRGSCPGPCALQGPGPKGIFPKGAFPKGAFGGFSKGLVPVLIRLVAGGLFSFLCPDGLVPGAGGAGHVPGTGTTGATARAGQAEQSGQSGHTGRSGTSGKEATGASARNPGVLDVHGIHDIRGARGSQERHLEKRPGRQTGSTGRESGKVQV